MAGAENRKNSSEFHMKLTLELLSSEYLGSDIRFHLQAKYNTDESLDEPAQVPKAPFQRSLQQVRYLDKALRATFSTSMFPVSSPKINKSDPRWGTSSLLKSITWHVERFFKWVLSKPQVCRSDLLADFLHTPLFGARNGWDGGVLDEFKSIFGGIRDTFSSGTPGHLPRLHCTSLEEERAELGISFNALMERHDSIEGLLEALQADFAWSRNLLRAAEDVGRSICDADKALDKTSTAGAVQLYTSLRKQRDVQEAMLSDLSDELAACLSLQLKEHLKAARFLKIWVKSLSDLDTRMGERLVSGTEEATQEGVCEREARSALDVTKENCKKEVDWFFYQSDLELSHCLKSTMALRATSSKAQIKLF